MKRTRLCDRMLPVYSRGEELMNMITHIVGGVLGIVVLLSCVILAALRNNLFGILSCTIYGTTFITMFTISSVYHGLAPGKFNYLALTENGLIRSSRSGLAGESMISARPHLRHTAVGPECCCWSRGDRRATPEPPPGALPIRGCRALPPSALSPRLPECGARG